MKKVVGLIVLLMFVLTMVIGCGTQQAAPAADTTKAAEAPKAEPAKTAKKEIVLAGIYKALDQVWFQDEGNAAKKKAMEMGAKDLLLIDAKMNPDTFLAALDNVIAQGVSGVLTCVPDQKLSKATLDRLKAANIPVIACDDALQDESGKSMAPFVGIDAGQIGKDMSTWAVEYVKKNNFIKDKESTGLLLMTVDQVSSCLPRTAGQLEIWKKDMADFSEKNIIKSDYNGETEKAFTAAAGVLTANPKIKSWIVMTVNDEGAAGATRALEQANLANNSIVVGLGGYLAKGEFKKEKSAFIASAFIDANDIGASSAKEMMEFILNKTEIPADYRIKAKMVTKDNYKEVMGKAAE